MIEINLLPEGLRKKEAVKIALPEIPIRQTLQWIVVILLIFHGLLGIALAYVHIEVAALERNIDTLQVKNKEVISQKAEITGMNNRLKEIRSFTSRKFYWTSLLSALSNSMTKGVWLRGLRVDEEEVALPAKTTDSGKKSARPAVSREKYLVLEGSAIGAGQETALLGKFLKELKDNAYFAQLFSDIKPSNINQKRLGDYEVYEFVVRCHFRKEKIA